MKKNTVKYIKLFEICYFDNEEHLYEVCTFAANPVVAGDVARAMCAANPGNIYETREFNEDDEVIGKYRPYC